jgi:hypothetical protein
MKPQPPTSMPRPAPGGAGSEAGPDDLPGQYWALARAWCPGDARSPRPDLGDDEASRLPTVATRRLDAGPGLDRDRIGDIAGESRPESQDAGVEP